jgi:hypothetical protein
VHILFGGVGTLHANGLRGPVNRENFVIDVSVDARAIPHFLGGHDEQAGAILNFSADEVGQSTVRERDVWSAFEDVDFGVFIHSAGSGSRRCSAGDAADDDDLS